MLDSETDLIDGGSGETGVTGEGYQSFASLLGVQTQYQWLEQDLASVDRSKTPWLITTTHRPIYTDKATTNQYMIAEFEPLCEFPSSLLAMSIAVESTNT